MHLYDAASNLAQTRAYTTSNEYTVTKNVYDDRNRLEYFITIPNSSEQNIVKYTYDASGRVLSVSEGLANISDTPSADTHRITTYAYDTFGNLMSEIDSLGQTEEYTYDIHGNMISFTDRNGTEFVYEYDILGRLLSEDYASSEENQDSISYTYDFLGNTLSMIDNRGEILYSYDKIGNMISEASDGNIKTYTYDANGNNLSFKLDIEEDTKQQVSYTYDASNRVSLITEGNNTTAYTYDANGNILTETVKSGNIIRRNTTFEYDSSNRPIHKRVYIGSDYEDYTMTYNLMGNVTRVDTKIYDYDTRTSDTSYVIYTYDGANRLVKEEYSDGSSIEYTYDKFGNMSSKTTGDVTSTYEYDKNNRLTSYSQERENTDTYNKIKYFYDNNGNMVSKIIDIVNTPENIKDNLYRIHQDDYSRVSLYEYDKRNRLSKATTDKGVATYTYRGDNFRDSKTVTTNDTTKTTDFIYNGMYIVYDTDGTASNTYSRGLTDLIFKTDNLNTVSYFITNQHGDVSALVSSNGTPISSYKYDAYGNIISDKDTNDTNPFSYCGEYLDFETGFIYLRNRYYDPDTARFITQDPIKDGLNWYAYCGGNPVMFVDPSGLVSDGKAIGGLVIWDNDAIKYGSDSIKYKLLSKMKSMASNENSAEIRDEIESISDKLRNFDDNSFNRAIFLNDKDGAETLGHTGIMLLNKNNEGLVFSYYPSDQSDIKKLVVGIDGELRMGILSEKQVNDLLYGSGNINGLVDSYGDIESEQYERFIYFDITNGNGYNMYHEAAKIFESPGTYSLLGHQCDDVANYIFSKGKIDYTVMFTPNMTYEEIDNNSKWER